MSQKFLASSQMFVVKTGTVSSVWMKRLTLISFSLLFVNILKVKGKCKLSLCLTKHHAMKTYWGSGSTDSRILDLGIREKFPAPPGNRNLEPRSSSP
jgi:hypothetical protein